MSLKLLLFWATIIASLLFFHTKGFISHDEGWVLNAAARLLDGQVPYRDFYFLYTPGSIFSVALWFKLFGESILAARILALVFSVISVFFICKLISQIHNSRFIILNSILLFLVWGPFQINFVWMVMLSISSGLATVYFLLRAHDNSNFAYFAGISAALTLLFKQNFGAAILVVSVIAFIFNSKLLYKRKVLNYVFGFVSEIGLFIVYLLANNTFFIFINQMYYLLFQKIFLEGMLSSPFIYPDAMYKQAIKLAFYTFPLILSLFAIFITRKNNMRLIFLVSFPMFYYLMSIRPTTDIIHLAPLISISGINFALIYKFSKSESIKKATVLSLIFFIILGAYVVVFRGYYRWESPILSHNIFYKDPKVNIFVDQKSNQVLKEVIPEIKKTKSDYIFVYHFAPMFYFISDKKNPTYYDDLQPKLLTSVEQAEIVLQLRLNRVDTILSNSDIVGEKTILTKFILANYRSYKTSHDYTIWKAYAN